MLTFTDCSVVEGGSYAGGAAVTAGTAVKTDPGANAKHPTLPRLVPAANNDTDVYVLFAENTFYPTPFPNDLLTASPTAAAGDITDPRTASASTIWTQDMFREQPQNMGSAYSIASGTKVLAVRGGKVTLPSGLMAAGYYNPGTKLKWNGTKWASTTTAAETVATVLNYLPDGTVQADFLNRGAA